MLVPRACARAFGMGWGVESSGGSGGLPPVLWFLLEFGVSDELVGGNIVHVYGLSQGVRVTFGGRITLTLALSV